jgi:hypothetical protein
MLRKLRAHFRQQFVGYLALFVALGGSAYAAATIGPSNIQNDAVRSRHIKNGQVKNPDLAANSVGSGKVIDNSLTGADIKESTLGTVPNATHADSATNATNAGHASSADSATNAADATNAANAGDANALGGFVPAAFSRSYSVENGESHGNGGYSATIRDGTTHLGDLSFTCGATTTTDGGWVYSASTPQTVFLIHGATMTPTALSGTGNINGTWAHAGDFATIRTDAGGAVLTDITFSVFNNAAGCSIVTKVEFSRQVPNG